MPDNLKEFNQNQVELAKLNSYKAIKKRLCRGGKLLLTKGKDGLEMKIEGCENIKRHSSKWCQDCSNKHNNK